MGYKYNEEGEEEIFVLMFKQTQTHYYKYSMRAESDDHLLLQETNSTVQQPHKAPSCPRSNLTNVIAHWHRLVKNIGGENPNFGGKCGKN